MYTIHEIVHILLVIFYGIYTIFPILFIYINLSLNSRRSYYLRQRFKLSFIISLYGIVSGISEIYLNGFKNGNADRTYILLLLNFDYVFGALSFISNIYVGFCFCASKYNWLKLKKHLKNICIFVYTIILFFVLITDLLLYYEIIESYKIYLYGFIIIIHLYFICILLNIYFLCKTNNSLKYNYITCVFTMAIRIFIDTTYIFMPESNTVIMFKKYCIVIVSFLSYLGFFIIPLITMYRKNIIKNIDNENNINIDKTVLKDKKEFISFYKQFKHFKKEIRNIKDNDDKTAELYTYFFKKCVIQYKTVYFDKIIEIENKIKNNNYYPTIYDELFYILYENLLINIYAGIAPDLDNY